MLLFVLAAFFGVFVLAAPTQTGFSNTTSNVTDILYGDPPPLGPDVILGSVVLPDGTVISTDGPGTGTIDAEKPQATLVLTMGTHRYVNLVTVFIVDANVLPKPTRWGYNLAQHCPGVRRHPGLFMRRSGWTNSRSTLQAGRPLVAQHPVQCRL